IADVVERFPRHATGERPVTDDGDDVAVALPGHLERTRNAVCPAQRARRMGTLDDVVGGFVPLRVTGEATALAQLAEVLATGQKLVDVGLVTGVEDDGVGR